MSTTSKLVVTIFLLVSCVGSHAQRNTINPILLKKIWSAKWIRCKGTGAHDYGVYHFRKSLVIDKKPASYVIHITADNRYRLFVNGQAIGFGPARADAQHWIYDTYDLSPYLLNGNNIIAVQVWNMGNYAPGAQETRYTGLLIQGDTDAEQAINTNDSWKAVKDIAYSPLPNYTDTGAGDSINTASYPIGWEKAGFNDDNFFTVEELNNGKPFGASAGWGLDADLVPRPIPFMEETKQYFNRFVSVSGISSDTNLLTGRAPVTIPANTKCTILIDQGYLTTGYPELEISAGTGSQIKLTYAEALVDSHGRKGNRNETAGKHITGMHDAIAVGLSNQFTFRPLWQRTWRFLQLDIQTSAQPLTINRFYSTFTAYPFQQRAVFNSSDTTLKNIWNVCWRTARLCAGETYFDCPYYEQLQYVGDTRIQSLISLNVAGDDRLMRNAITLIARSEIAEGITTSRAPGNSKQYIPPFSLYWIDMVYDFSRYRNDTAFVKQFLPGVRHVLSFFESKLNRQGLIQDLGFWNFVDWPQQWQQGIPPGADSGVSSILNMAFAYTLDHAAAIMESYHYAADAAHYRQLALSIKKTTYQQFYSASKQLIADEAGKTKFSQHANILAILTDVIPQAAQQSVYKRIMTDSSLTQTSLYYQFYLAEAMKKTGMTDDYFLLLNNWRQMLDMGLTTFPEIVNEPRSDCHAWSASPAYECVSLIAGIEPASFGFNSVRIEPALGKLEMVDCTMPHPNGNITVKLNKTKNSKLVGTITLPGGLKGNFVWHGKSKPLVSGSNEIAVGL